MDYKKYFIKIPLNSEYNQECAIDIEHIPCSEVDLDQERDTDKKHDKNDKKHSKKDKKMKKDKHDNDDDCYDDYDYDKEHGKKNKKTKKDKHDKHDDNCDDNNNDDDDDDCDDDCSDCNDMIYYCIENPSIYDCDDEIYNVDIFIDEIYSANNDIIDSLENSLIEFNKVNLSTFKKDLYNLKSCLCKALTCPDCTQETLKNSIKFLCCIIDRLEIDQQENSIEYVIEALNTANSIDENLISKLICSFDKIVDCLDCNYNNRDSILITKYNCNDEE